MVVSKETPVFFVRPASSATSTIEQDKELKQRMGAFGVIDASPSMLRIATPLIVVSALLGLAPVQPASTSSAVADAKTDRIAGRARPHVLVRSVWLEVYSIVILGLITVSSYFVFKASGDESLKLNSLANASVSVLVQVATLWTTKSAIDSVEGLLDCEEETQTMTPARVRTARIWVAVQLLLWATVSVVFAVHHVFFEVPSQLTQLSFCYRAYSVSRPFMHMSCMQFANQAHALSLQLTSINDRLLTMLGPVSAGLTPRTLEMWSRLGDAANPLRQPPLHPDVEAAALETTRELRLLHHKMHVIAGYLQSAYGPQMLLVLLSTLLDYTTMLFILLARIEIDAVGLIIGTTHVLVMYLVLTSGNMVRQEAQRMGEILQRGLVHRRLSERLVEELQDFSLQLVRLPTRLSACGLMYLDYSMIQGAVGTVTTYLVIMLQFPNNTGGAAKANGTESTPTYTTEGGRT
ncbi:Gustatory receptor 91 [Frankliniella occidentalis]|nr:Gustatory receptor 91 [Frankliniella occidentalis]